EPKTFSIDGDDETRADLAEGLQIGDFIRMRKPRRGANARGREICGPLSLGGLRWQRDRFAESDTGLESKALLDRTKRRSCGYVETAVRAYAGTNGDLFHRRDDRTRHSG